MAKGLGLVFMNDTSLISGKNKYMSIVGKLYLADNKCQQ